MLRRRKNKAPPLPPICPLTECMRLLGGVWTANSDREELLEQRPLSDPVARWGFEIEPHIADRTAAVGALRRLVRPRGIDVSLQATFEGFTASEARQVGLVG